MRRLLAVSLMLFAVGCSIMDPSDRQELRDRIQSMPENQVSMLTNMAMRKAASDFLTPKPQGDRIGKLECRVKEDGAWGDWYEHDPSLRVVDMLHCFFQNPDFNFMMCREWWEAKQVNDKREYLRDTATNPESIVVECRYTWDVRYEPEKLPPEVTDSKAVSIDEIIDTVVSLPAPPPGWAFPELVPLLCPLGAGSGWGCPPKPDDPTQGQPSDTSSDQPGDHP